MIGSRFASSIAGRIDALLPQTQCRKCGYQGCRPYAEAVAAGDAGINQCPPGGDALARRLATLLGVPFKPLDPAFGVCQPPAVAVIDEALCIGCTLCIQACPVDAIVGASRFMHTVIAAECTGCELCIPPCPVDCIRMLESGRARDGDDGRTAAERARRRFEARNERLKRDRLARAARLSDSREKAAGEKKRATIEKAIARARQRLQQRRA
ncbi:MAG: RnfABCDGE type electron transport complex subunit B [Betaproteobacteria bacterium]|nr:RnfABCDGE type electron transport complex subunit B [Betaproteobacteria bacterium]